MEVALTGARSGTAFDDFLAKYLDRDLLRFTTAGSVDDGKSTLIGRLLYDSKSVYQDQVQAIQKSRLNRSTGPMDFSLLTDGLRAEREQGITIDVAYRYFSTPRRKFIIADTPGHEQYTRNMATGASTADAAVVLVDARKGILPQSRRHASIAALLGIHHIVAAINKMDLVDYSEEVFLRLDWDFRDLATQVLSQAGEDASLVTVTCIPISALEGDNVVTRGTHTPWYTGPTLLEHLETIPLADRETAVPFRFPVQYVIRPDHTFRGFAGRIVGGSVKAGDKVLALPSRQTTRVRSIVTFNRELPRAVAGSSVTLQLEDELDLSRGDVLVSEDGVPHIGRTFVANVVWLHDTPLDLKNRWILRHGTEELRVRATRIQSRLDVNTMERHVADRLGLNDIGVVEFEATRSFAFDLYRKNRGFGSFILIDPLSNATVGAGMIVESLSERAIETGSRLKVVASDRSRRFGHHSGAVLLASRFVLTESVEHLLFEAGIQVTVADHRHGADWNDGFIRGLYAAGLVAVYAAPEIADEVKNRISNAIPVGRVLDVDTLTGDDASVLRQVEEWMEGLRLASRGGNA